MNRFDMHIEIMPVKYRDLEYMKLLEPENSELGCLSESSKFVI